jgi:hypothetical protein
MRKEVHIEQSMDEVDGMSFPTLNDVERKLGYWMHKGIVKLIYGAEIRYGLNLNPRHSA